MKFKEGDIVVANNKVEYGHTQVHPGYIGKVLCIGYPPKTKNIWPNLIYVDWQLSDSLWIHENDIDKLEFENLLDVSDFEL